MPAPQDRPLVTFDVFDTVMTRAVGSPRSVGYVLAERARTEGLVNVSGEVFVAARERAEHLAYLRHGEARRMEQACVQLADLLGLAPEQALDLERLELAVELELTRPVPAQVAQVVRARAAGAQVGFLSDTPLPRTAVESMLRRAGAMQDGDVLWVSNELGAEKATGRAYAAVARQIGEPPISWRHTGDNSRSDVTMARWSGVRAALSPSASLNRFETRLEAFSAATGGASSMLAGASRRARLLLADTDVGADQRLPTVTGVLGPLLAALAIDVLRAASAAGCDRLVVTGVAAADLLAVAAPLRDVVAPGLDLSGGPAPGGGRWALVGTDVLRGPAPAGPAVQHHLGVAQDVIGSVTGWAFDERAGTGATGAAAEALRGVMGLLPTGHPGLPAFGQELGGVLAALPARADLRAAVQDVVDELWERPTAGEVAAWTAALPGLRGRWRHGRRATAPWQALRRVADVAGAGRRKLRRARLLADARRTVRHGP